MASLKINSFAIESDLNSLIVEYQRTHEQANIALGLLLM